MLTRGGVAPKGSGEISLPNANKQVETAMKKDAAILTSMEER